MSHIEITVGSATAGLRSVADVDHGPGTFPHYLPRDLMDATAAALLAVNTPIAVKYAHALYQLTKDAGTNPEAIRRSTREEIDTALAEVTDALHYTEP